MGAWSLQGTPGEVALSDLGLTVERVVGGQLPAVSRLTVAPALGSGLLLQRSLVRSRQVTLYLTPARRRNGGDAAARAALLPYCVPDVGITLLYSGTVRTVECAASYLDGLDDLALQFLCVDPAWYGGGTQTVAIPGAVTALGTASAQPRILFDAAGGTVTSVQVTNGLGTFGLPMSLTLSAGQSATLDLASRTFVRQPGSVSVLSALQPGAQLASFALLPGSNTFSVTKTGSVALSVQYEPRWWSWESGDQ